MKSILKRVHFFFIGLAAILATIFAFPALAGGPMAKPKFTTTRLQNGALIVERFDQPMAALAKATRLEAKYCRASPIHSPENNPGEVPTTTERIVYFAMPTICHESMYLGFTVYGAYERMDFAGSVWGVAYYKAVPMPDEPPLVLYPNGLNIRDEVYVYDESEMVITIGTGETLTIYPEWGSPLFGTVSGRAQGNRNLSCPPSGCRTVRESLGWGMWSIQATWHVPPGMEVWNFPGNEFVGIALATDKGKTAIIGWDALMGGLYELGILKGGGKG